MSTERTLAGAARIVRTHARTRWVSLVGWTLGLSLLVLAIAASIKGLYPSLQHRIGYAESMGASPAVAAFNGRGFDLTTLGGIAAYEVGFMGMLIFPLAFAHLAIRLTRSEEDSGRTELIRSGRVGRLATLAAAAIALLLVAVTLTVAVAAGLSALGFPAGGSWKYAVILSLYGLMFGSLALVAAEVSSEARTAYALSLLTILVCFLVRALIDGRGWSATALSPMGWLADARPWGPAAWWPYAAYALSTIAAIAVAAWLGLHRDLGSGIIATGRGPARAAARLGSPIGFAWRLTRTPFYGWLVGLIVWGAAIGSLSSEMTDLVASNPTITEALGVERPEYLVTVMALLLAALGSAALGLQGIGRLAREEDAGRLGLALSTRVSRRRLWLGWVVLLIVLVTITLAASTIAVALTTWAVTGQSASVGPSLSAGAALLPAVVFIVAVGAALHGCVTRWAPLAWLIVGWAGIVGVLAETLQLPEWTRDLSPLHLIGNVPIETASAPAVIAVCAAALVLVLVGMLRFGQRDLVAG